MQLVVFDSYQFNNELELILLGYFWMIVPIDTQLKCWEWATLSAGAFHLFCECYVFWNFWFQTQEDLMCVTQWLEKRAEAISIVRPHNQDIFGLCINFQLNYVLIRNQRYVNWTWLIKTNWWMMSILWCYH